MRRLVLVLGLLAAGGAWLWLARDRADPAATNLVLITIDTLRADRLADFTMPALSRAAASARRFTHARTTAPLTLPAHASIMTGLLPPEHGARENGVTVPSTHATLARTLRTAGFRTGAFVSAFVLDRQFGLAEGFEVYDAGIARDPRAPLRLEAERSGRATVDAALAWLESVNRGRERFFLWVHVFEPHAPYPDGYDTDVAAADTQAARLLDAITRAPGGASTAWIVAGDHGEALGSHGEATHGMLLYDTTLRVPLIAGGAGMTAAVDASPVSLIDIAPTALRWLGFTPPPAMRGVDLRSDRPADRDVYSETIYPRAAGWQGLSALSGERWKIIRSSEPELYDITADPAETTNLAGAHAQTAQAMERAAGKIANAAPGAAAAPSADAQERLRALGYVSGAAAARADVEGAPNPAREIASWSAFERALTLVAQGRAADALSDLARLSARYPSGRVFQTTYAQALQDTGDLRRALALRRAIVAAHSGDAMLFQDLAVTARLAGDGEEARRAGEAALALDPGNAAALNGLGLVHADAGRAADAARAFEQATARDAGNASYWTNLGNARRALGQAAEADAAYRRALDLAPNHADALNGLGTLLVQAGRAGDAVPLFRRALAADGSLIEARLNLGIAFQESGRPSEAAAIYRDVITRARPGTREHTAASALLSAVK